MNPDLSQLRAQIQAYQPFDEQETNDKTTILQAIDAFPNNILLRENTLCYSIES